MLGSLFRLAKEEVETTLGNVVEKVLLAIPFLLTAVFATAAASIWLMREFGSIAGLLIMAGAFLLLGMVGTAVTAARSKGVGTETVEVEANAEHPADPNADALASKADREFVLSALASAAPVALPPLLRLIVRNLPIFAALVLSIYVITRNAAGASSPPTGAEPDTASATDMAP